VYPENFSRQAAEEHYQYLLREACMERLTHLKPHQTHPTERGLYRLGQQLVVWSYRLQARYNLKKRS
jgi:hypothetical protein